MFIVTVGLKYLHVEKYLLLFYFLHHCVFGVFPINFQLPLYWLLQKHVNSPCTCASNITLHSTPFEISTDASWVTTCSIQPSWISCMSLYFLILTLIKLYLKNYHTFIRLFLISPNIFIVSAMCLLGIHVLALPCGIKRLATWAYVFSYNYLTGSLLRNRLYIIYRYIVFIFIVWEKLKTLSLFKNVGCLNVTLCC